MANIIVSLDEKAKAELGKIVSTPVQLPFATISHNVPVKMFIDWKKVATDQVSAETPSTAKQTLHILSTETTAFATGGAGSGHVSSIKAELDNGVFTLTVQSSADDNIPDGVQYVAFQLVEDLFTPSSEIKLQEVLTSIGTTSYTINCIAGEQSYKQDWLTLVAYGMTTSDDDTKLGDGTVWFEF